jgi:hypothetical protein
MRSHQQEDTLGPSRADREAARAEEDAATRAAVVKLAETIGRALEALVLTATGSQGNVDGHFRAVGEAICDLAEVTR